MEQLTRIQFVVDGSYGRKIYDHLSKGIDSISYSINWDKLQDYASSAIKKADGKRCVFTKKVFFIGTNPEFDEENFPYYHSLETSGVQRISLPLRSAQSKDGKPAYKEEAVDTSLVFGVAKDFYTSKIEDRFDWLVLVAGDGDLVPLVQGLSTEGVRTLIIYFDFSTPFGTTRASQGLLEAAEKVISLESLLKERVDSDAKAVFTATEKPADKKGTEGSIVASRPAFAAKRASEAITAMDIERAITNTYKQDGEGWVLVAHLGKTIEMMLGAKLPYGVKLKTEIQKYPEKFETKELPAFSVRLKEKKQRVVLVKKPTISYSRRQPF